MKRTISNLPVTWLVWLAPVVCAALGVAAAMRHVRGGMSGNDPVKLDLARDYGFGATIEFWPLPAGRVLRNDEPHPVVGELQLLCGSRARSV